MGFTFDAVVADIEASASGMTSAGEAVGAADPTADLASVAAALEGSASSAAATSLTTAWSKRFSTWSSDAKLHGEARLTSSEQYTRADHQAAQQMESDAWASRGPAMHRDE